jgi:hypothetical protein
MSSKCLRPGIVYLILKPIKGKVLYVSAAKGWKWKVYLHRRER